MVVLDASASVYFTSIYLILDLIVKEVTHLRKFLDYFNFN